MQKLSSVYVDFSRFSMWWRKCAQKICTELMIDPESENQAGGVFKECVNRLNV